MDKAEQHGSRWVSVCNTNHFGIAGYYSLKALERRLALASITLESIPKCRPEKARAL